MKTSLLRRVLVLIVAMISIGVLPASAATTMGLEFTILEDSDQEMRIPYAIFHAASEQFLVIWSERANEEIRGQLIDLDGTKSGTELTIASGGGERDFPSAAHITNRLDLQQQMSLVVWDDTQSGQRRIRGQLISADGSSLSGSDFEISTDEGQFPAVAYGQTGVDAGVFLAVWQGISGDHSKVFGQLLRGATHGTGLSVGELIGANFQIADVTSSDTLDPKVAFDPATRHFLVVWADTRGSTDLEYDIWGQRVDENGNLIGGNFQISSQTGFERFPLVAYHPLTKEFLVVWNQGQPHENVFAQRVTTNGTRAGQVINVATTSAEESAVGLVANHDTGGYVIPLVVDNTVKMQLLTLSGAVDGAPSVVSTNSVANKGRVVAAYGGTIVCAGGGVPGISEVFMVWPEDRTDSGRRYWQHLYGRMVELQSDSDCDGLMDDWETTGLDINGDGNVDLDLPALGADPDHKDLFIEVDFFDCSIAGADCGVGDAHSHRPQANAINTVAASFAAAPLMNPDGLPGITLHVEVDEALPHQVTCQFDATCFDPLKRAHFGTPGDRASANAAQILIAKRLVYRYNLWAHNTMPASALSGIAELPGNDFIVSLGSWPTCTPGFADACDRNPNGTPTCAGGARCESGGTLNEQTGTFMHEMGHTLGLRHGGSDHENCKPNYLSTMTYIWQTIGLQPGDVFDYSRNELPPLDENWLDETQGIQDGPAFDTFFGPPADLDGIDQPLGAPDGNLNDDWATGSGQGPIDWNQSCSAGVVPGCDLQNPVVANINNMGINGCRSAAMSVLNGNDDWNNLTLNFRNTADWIEGVHHSAVEMREMTVADAVAVEAQRPPTLVVPTIQQQPINGQGYPVPSNLDWTTQRTATQPIYHPVEIDFDNLELSSQLAGLSLPIDLIQVQAFEWLVNACDWNREYPVVATVSGQSATLGQIEQGPLDTCSGTPGFGGNVITLAPGTVEFDLSALRQFGFRVVEVSTIVRSCGGNGTFQVVDAGGYPANSLDVYPSESTSEISLQGKDIVKIEIKGQEMVIDRIGLTVRCPGQLECSPLAADDFLAEAAPVEAITFWGAYLDNRFMPARFGGTDNDKKDVDGWFVGFHSDQARVSSATYSRPNTLLGRYYCPSDVVTIIPTDLYGCIATDDIIFRYNLQLSNCLPVDVAHRDPRDFGNLDAVPPALGNVFLPREGRVYWLTIQAATGITFDPYTLRPSETINRAETNFWGWLAVPLDQPLGRSTRGCSAVDFNEPERLRWLQGDWIPVDNNPCVVTNQAFELTGAVTVPTGSQIVFP